MESDTSETLQRATGRPASQDTSAASPEAPGMSGARSAPLSPTPATDATPANIDRSSWIQEDDSVRAVLYMSATGKHPLIGGPTVPLYRPNRFHSPSPLRSMVILLVVVALIIVIPIGVILADRATSSIQIPGISGGSATETPATTTTPAVTVTVTPKK